MKTFKILFVLLAVSAATFYSCSDSDPVANHPIVTQKSVAMRTALNEVKKSNAIGNRSAHAAGKTATDPFCFDFVYPLTFQFNNGTLVTVANFQGLVDVLTNESSTFYVEGMVFPFHVTRAGVVLTISNEDDFNDLLMECNFNTLAQDLQYSYCFDLVFPINLTAGDQTVEANNIEELTAQLGAGAQIVYPISVHYEGQVVIINNLYELYDMINNCSTCVCTQEYAPVCVQTPVGIEEFGNLCQAICAGYTQNDLVPCNGNPSCNISNITTNVGDCSSTGTYQLTLDFDYGNVSSSTQFGIYVNGAVLQNYPLSALPVTLTLPGGANGVSSLTIVISGTNCTATTQWNLPSCGCNCPTVVDQVCVQGPNGVLHFDNACLAQCAGYTPSDFITCGVVPSNFGTLLGSCFYIQYPVGVQAQGQIVTVQNNGQLLQYWNPVQTMPVMVYPITVIFGNSVYTFENQSQFEAQITAHCN